MFLEEELQLREIQLCLQLPDALVTDVPTIMAYGAEFFSDAATQRETLNLAQEQHVAITGVEPVLEEVNA